MMNLCVAMAPNMVQTSELDSSSPTASPSNTAWKERANTVKKSLMMVIMTMLVVMVVIKDGVEGEGQHCEEVPGDNDDDDDDDISVCDDDDGDNLQAVVLGPKDSTLTLSQIF